MQSSVTPRLLWSALLTAGLLIGRIDLAAAQTAIDVSTTAALQNAVSTANSLGGNVTISLADGTYSLTDTLYVNAPRVTITGASGDRTRVVIQGDAMSDTANVKNLIRVAASNFTLQNVTLRRAGWHLLQIAGESNADSPVVRNVIFRDSYQQMLKVSTAPNAPVEGSDNGLVESSLFEYTAGIGPQYYIGGIDAHNARNWIVRNNTFRGIASPSTGVAEFAIHFWNSSADNLVEKNLIVNCDRGIGFGLDGRPNSAGIIRNNMIYHADNGAPYADAPIALTESRDTQVYNNTIYLENSFPWAIEYRFPTTSGVTIVNNLANRPVRQRDGASGTTANNVANAAASWFVNPAGGDLHLSSGVSSVMDKGQSVAGLTDDFDGQARPQGAGIDIGADEVSAAVAPKPPTNVEVT